MIKTVNDLWKSIDKNGLLPHDNLNLTRTPQRMRNQYACVIGVYFDNLPTDVVELAIEVKKRKKYESNLRFAAFRTAKMSMQTNQLEEAFNRTTKPARLEWE